MHFLAFSFQRTAVTQRTQEMCDHAIVQDNLSDYPVLKVRYFRIYRHYPFRTDAAFVYTFNWML